MKVGFIGVGAMGRAMAGHVAAAGFETRVFDLDASALAEAAAAGLRTATTDEIAQQSDLVVIVVNTDDQTRAVVRQLLGADPKVGLVIAVAATNHPRTMIELAETCAGAGLRLVDAPVCYGLKGAIDGDLVSLCGGAPEDIDAIRPVLAAYSRSVEHLGPVGAGQIGKACNNMMHWAACVANFETLALARACGIDAQMMRETLLKCPARNTTLERWDSTRLTWHEKDMDVVMDLGQSAGLALPLFGAIDQLVKRISPEDIKALLYGETARYLGQTITDPAKQGG